MAALLPSACHYQHIFNTQSKLQQFLIDFLYDFYNEYIAISFLVCLYVHVMFLLRISFLCITHGGFKMLLWIEIILYILLAASMFLHAIGFIT